MLMLVILMLILMLLNLNKYVSWYWFRYQNYALVLYMLFIVCHFLTGFHSLPWYCIFNGVSFPYLDHAWKIQSIVFTMWNHYLKTIPNKLSFLWRLKPDIYCKSFLPIIDTWSPQKTYRPNVKIFTLGRSLQSTLPCIRVADVIELKIHVIFNIRWINFRVFLYLHQKLLKRILNIWFM